MPILTRSLTWIGKFAALVAGAVAAALVGPTVVRGQTARPAACVSMKGAPQPVIDVHMHAIGSATWTGSLAGDTTALRAVIAELDRNHVIAVVASSLMLPRTLQWVQRDARFIPTLAFRDTTMSVDTVRALLQRGTVRGLGELGFQYAGLRPDDPALDKYFALAEEFDVPVAVHMAGGGLPDIPAFRVRLGDPLVLEEVLIRHPRLRVNLMHAGLPFLESTLAIMRRYPQVYADLSKISDSTAYPRGQFHDYLRALMRANLGARLMFGSDAAGSGAVTAGIEGIISAAFLTSAQQRDILCDNAARFYRLDVKARPAQAPTPD
jgi:predicted TIM-barrel fold metal-dependent hydrolase